MKHIASSLGTGLGLMVLISGSVSDFIPNLLMGTAYAAASNSGATSVKSTDIPATTQTSPTFPTKGQIIKTERVRDPHTGALTTTTTETPDAFSGDPWKGPADKSDFDFGAMTGLGMVQGSPAFALVGTLSRKIDYVGFIDGIRNSLSVEATVGPMFLKGTSAFSYSTHLRWDFKRDETWTYYALGGPAGYITGTKLGDQFALYPRFGVGAFWQITAAARIRFELSHELTAVGVAIPL